MDTASKELLDSIPNATSAPADAVPLTFTNFSRQDLLRVTSDGKVYGNWGPSFSAACIDPFANKYINKGAIIRIQAVGPCASGGHTIVMAEHY